MKQRGSRQRNSKPATPAIPLDPGSAYHASMLLLRDRFVAIEQRASNENPLNRAEFIALQVRKIVEGVAYGCLSAVEHRNQQTLRELRSKDADKLLSWLEAKNLLKLPSAQRLKPSPSSDFRAVLEGAGSFDLNSQFLKAAYSRASALIHERHPEGLSQAGIESELAVLEADAASLRQWLWLHIMFLRDEGFLVQMGQYGTPSFMVPLTRTGDLPAGV